MAAKTAADAAKMASDEAATATMNLATTQTGAMSAMHAYNAKKYAKTAMDEYMKAKAASEAAAAATTTTAATTEKDKAVAAQMAAENAAMMVANDDMDGYADMAKMSAMTELMIDGTMKSVGDTMIDAASDATSVTTGTGDDAMTVITGLIESENPMGTSGPIAGRDYTPPVDRRSEHGRYRSGHAGDVVPADRAGAHVRNRQDARLGRRHGAPDGRHSLSRRRTWSGSLPQVILEPP